MRKDYSPLQGCFQIISTSFFNNFIELKVQDNRIEAMDFFIKTSLSDVYEGAELDAIRFLMYRHFCGLSRTDLLSKKVSRLTEGEMVKFFKAIKRLKKNEPIQYILGETDFCDLRIQVNSSVLIPRPETEELVKLVCNENVQKQLSVIDICTGSGCIPIALKKFNPDWKISALDKFEACINVAVANAKNHDLQIQFFKADIFDFSSPEKFDIIISNPPYVAQSEKYNMNENVLNFEPHSALFVDDEDPLVFYAKILKIGNEQLNENGKIYFEINPKYAKELLKLAEIEGYGNIRLINDIFGKERFLVTELKK
jgi:release factor glutamine methyltransferase